MAYPFERMTTKKLNSFFEKRRVADSKIGKQTQAKRIQPVKKTETICTVIREYSQPGDSGR
jgi:hypothetical protein